MPLLTAEPQLEKALDSVSPDPVLWQEMELVFKSITSCLLVLKSVHVATSLIDMSSLKTKHEIRPGGASQKSRSVALAGSTCTT